MHEDKLSQLAKLNATYAASHKCLFKIARDNHIVFGVGNPDAQIMFIGEAPGHDEDEQGVPFVGRSGKLLTKLLEESGLSRDEVYITNVVKCRPHENRAPTVKELNICKNAHLLDEIKIINPKVICTLGSTATKALLGAKSRIAKERGNVHQWEGFVIIPTYHPAYVLRNPSKESILSWDLHKIIKFLVTSSKA